MIRYVVASLRASLFRSKSLFLLTVTGVALGVAAVLSIQIINRSSLAAFEGGMQAISGETDLSVFGMTPELPSTAYRRVLGTEGVAAAYPILNFSVTLPDTNIFVEVVGADLLSASSLPFMEGFGEAAAPVWSEGWIAITPGLAGELGSSPGDTVTVEMGSNVVPLVVGSIVDFSRIAPMAPQRLAVMDIAEAQRLFGTPGVIHQIDVRASDQAVIGQLADSLRAALGPGVRVLTPEQRTRQASDIMGAFRLNLTALSLISLLVGLFLIHAATHASLVRRRFEFGLLRSLGATRGQVFGVIMAEIAPLGIVGVLLGIPLGYLAASANIEMVSATISNLYLLREVEQVTLPVGLILLAAVTGIGGACVGAALPALDISRSDTIKLLAPYELHRTTAARANSLLAAGIAVLAAVALWYFLLASDWKPAGFVLSLVLLGSIPLLAPAAVMALAGSVPVRDFGLSYSIGNLKARLQTTAFAVSALAVAVAMLVGITVMISSFRSTVEVWSHSVLGADIYLSPKSWRGAGDAAALGPQAVDVIANVRGTSGFDLARGFPIVSGNRQVFIGGYRLKFPEGATRFPLLDGESVDVQAAFAAGHALISEPLSLKESLETGDSVPVPGPGGTTYLRIAGVYHDYSSENGAISIGMERFEELFGPGQPNTAALHLDGSLGLLDVADLVRSGLGDLPVQVRTNLRLRQEALRIFDQTFAVTYLLQGMSLVIAVAGITLSLLVMAREQTSELALYVSLGARRLQLFGIYVGKGVAIGVLGIMVGSLVGLLLSAVLVYVVNRAYFGWTIQYLWPWGALANQVAVILAAAATAAIYPAFRASGVPATELSRDDF